MAFILNILIGISYDFKVPNFFGYQRSNFLSSCVNQWHCRQGKDNGYIVCDNEPYESELPPVRLKIPTLLECHLLVDYSHLRTAPRTSYLAPEEAYTDSLYPLEEEFLGSWKTLGMILLEARRPEGIPGSYLKELR